MFFNVLVMLLLKGWNTWNVQKARRNYHVKNCMLRIRRYPRDALQSRVTDYTDHIRNPPRKDQ